MEKRYILPAGNDQLTDGQERNMGIHEVILNLCYVQDEEGIIYSLRAKAYVAEGFSLRSRFGNLMKRFSDALNQTIFSNRL